MTVDPRLIHPATAGPDRHEWAAIDAAERVVNKAAQQLASGACPRLAHSPRYVSGSWSCPECAAEAQDAAEVAEREAAKAAARGQVTPEEWSTFLAAIRRVADDAGVVDQNKVRRLIRGRIQPKHIGTAYGIARRSGLLVESGTNRSDDTEGKNAGRWQPLYLLRSAA